MTRCARPAPPPVCPLCLLPNPRPVPMRCGGVGAAQDTARQFVMSHGLAVRAVGLLVDDAAAAYSAATAAGGEGVTPPYTLDSTDGAGRSVRPLRDTSPPAEKPMIVTNPVAAAPSPHPLGPHLVGTRNARRCSANQRSHVWPCNTSPSLSASVISCMREPMWRYPHKCTLRSLPLHRRSPHPHPIRPSMLLYAGSIRGEVVWRCGAALRVQ